MITEDQNELKRLEEELGKVNNQVQMWMRELDEVNDCRTELEVRNTGLSFLVVSCSILAEYTSKIIRNLYK